LFYELRPVGNRIKLASSGFDNNFLKPFSFIGFDSGTSALTTALIAVRRSKPTINNPKVLVPAYTCPDIVSACLYAKVTPVLVDFESNLPFMDLDNLCSKISDDCIAIIAINFMGIPERINAIRSAINTDHITIIEDSAQGFPINRPVEYWSGDLIIVSFGRGKPVNLMGGGALFFDKKRLNSDLLSEVLNFEIKRPKFYIRHALLYRTKAILFNLLSRPIFYFIVSRLPFLNLGTTAYHPLAKIGPLPNFIEKVIEHNYKNNYKDSSHFREIRERYDELFGQLEETIISLPIKTKLPGNFPLLRYPILILDKKLKQTIYQKLIDLGLGASLMYQTILPEVKDIEELMFETIEDYPNAKALADGLITLPMHQDIKLKHIKRMEKIILTTLATSN